MKKHKMSMPGHDILAKERTVDVITTENSSFKDLLLSYNVLSGLQKARFERPSPIQLKAIPYGRCGLDLIVQAKSGTGKTCVFTVIALEAISTEAPTLQVIILAPTREIAVQIEDVVKAVGQDIRGLKVGAFIGGRPLSEDKINAKGCHIAVGSPGRIFQLIELEVLKCQSVRIFVLDEADKLLEDNFQSQINSIYSMLPENKQMIAASATYPDELAQFVTRYMRDPTFIRLNPKDMALLGVKQYYYLIDDPPDKFYSVFECKIKAVVELLKLYPFQQTLIFSNYHSHAKDLSDACNSAGLPSTYISGNLEQERRLEAMKMLKDFKCRVLISTDLTARGIDASNVDLVVNLDVPYDWETYMHRTGRAGRFGSHGAVVSIVTSGTEIDELLEIAKTCAVTLLPMRVESGQINIGSSPGIFNDYSAQKSPDSRETNSSSEKDVTVGKTQNIPKIAKAESIGTGRNPIEAPEQSVDKDFPKIPSLPELMNKNSKSTGYKYSYKYSDVLENFKYFIEHGIFKEFKKREPPVEQIKSRSEQSMGFVNQESLADDLQSKLYIKDKPSTSDFSETMTIQSSKTSSVKNFEQNPSVIESIANDSDKFHKDDSKSTKNYDVHDMRQEMDKKSSVTNTKSVKAQKHCEGDYKGDVSDNVHDMFTNPKAKKSRKNHRSKKKQKGSRKGQDSDDFEDEEVPPFLLPRFSDNTEPDYLRNMTYSHQQMQAQMQYNMYWYNYYYYWQHWHNAQAMGNFGNPWHG